MSLVELKLVLEVVSLAVIAFGGVIAALKAVAEMETGRKSRERELRWRQAKEAKDIVDQLWDRYHSKCAMLILGRMEDSFKYKDPDDVAGEVKEYVVSIIDMIESLKKTEDFTDKDLYVRRCLEYLYDGFSQIEDFIDAELIQFEDVEHSLKVYVEIMSKDKRCFLDHIQWTEYERTLDFLIRFDAWAGKDD